MIKHIVFFDLAEEVEGVKKADIALKIKHDLEQLVHVVPELKKMEVGINHPEASDKNYDIALCAEFETMDDLKIYNNHPEHQKVLTYIINVKIARAAVDYEF